MPTMAFVTAKSGGRYEIRESQLTPAGPRSRTLVSFRTLNNDVLNRARARAQGSFDESKIRSGARRLGVPMEDSWATELARDLLLEMSQGRLPAPGLRRALYDALGNSGLPEAGGLGDLSLWVGASDEDRAAALADLLGLADAIPASARRKDSLEF